MSRSKAIVSVLLGVMFAWDGSLRAQESAPKPATAPATATGNASGPAAVVIEPAASALPAPLDTSVDNLGKQGLAIDGWDPVAYFPEGGGKAVEGLASIEVVLHGARYRFANEAHRTLFNRNPGRYVPAYGGWCAYAMAEGEKVEVDPESFLVQDGRLMVFYKSFFNDTRAGWVKDAALLPKADTSWKRLTGQDARGDKAAADAAAGRASGGASAATDALVIGHDVGQRAPAFTLKDSAGAEHSLADYRGKLVVLDFWATWCAPCKAAMPGVQKLHEKFGSKGVAVIGIDGFERNAKADPSGYMASKGCTYQLLLGGETLADSYAVQSLPTFVVIDEDGVIIAREVGAPVDESALASLIEKHLAGRAGS